MNQSFTGRIKFKIVIIIDSFRAAFRIGFRKIESVLEEMLVKSKVRSWGSRKLICQMSDEDVLCEMLNVRRPLRALSV